MGFPHHNEPEPEGGGEPVFLTDLPAVYLALLSEVWRKAGQQMAEAAEAFSLASDQDGYAAATEVLNEAMSMMMCSRAMHSTLGSMIYDLKNGVDAIVPWEEFIPRAVERTIQHFEDDHGVVLARVPDVLPDNFA